MVRRFTAALLFVFLVISNFAATAQQPTPPNPPTPTGGQPSPSKPEKDPNDPNEKIRDEGMNRSQVMQTLGYLTDGIGPRLTGSPNLKRANEWTRDTLTSWGLQNAHLEAWGPFGRGWSLKRFSAQVVEPQNIPLIAYPKAWSPSLNGVLTAEVVYLDAKDEPELEKFKGKLKGRIVLVGAMREVKTHFDPESTRLTEKDLLKLADAPEPRRPGGRPPMNPEQRARGMFTAKRLQFLHDEEAALIVESSSGDDGTVFVQGANVPQPFSEQPSNQNRISAWQKNAPRIIPQVSLASEHFNRLVRMMQQGQKPKMMVDLVVQFHDEDPMAYNTIAEIPGTDLKDEIVMLGGHMDSWHGGTGATDNGAGVAVAMEAVRILQAAKLQPRRTIRIGLWSGEEQGLLGSRAYVAEHLGAFNDPASANVMAALAKGEFPPMTLKAEYDKFSAYFNLDNGTGKIRGVYLQGNEAARPIFRRWLDPFRDLGAATLTISNTSGTDHQSFDRIGLPGFQFIQDEIDYETRTHHSNQDVFDRIQADDLKQASVIMAAFIYNAALMDEKFPRKPRPAK